MTTKIQPSSFPILRAARPNANGFIAAVETIAQGVEAQRIFNVDLKDAKDTLNRVVYEGQGALRAQFINGGKWETLPAEVYALVDSFSLYDAHSSISASKKLAATKLSHPAIDAYRAFVAEASTLALAVASLKPFIVSGRKPDPAAAARKAASAPKNPMARGTCGCCFADQAVLPNGLVHDHGYTLPQSWHKSASCYGLRFQPLEVSVAGPVFMADLLKKYIAETKKALVEAPSRKSITKTNRYKGTSVVITPADGGFEYELRQVIAGLEQALRGAQGDLAKFEKVIAEWKPAK